MEGLGTDAGTGAPNVAEPEVDGAGAPIKKASAEVAAPLVAKASEAEPKEKTEKKRTIDDDLEEVFKKHGGTTYKAGGKEKKAASWAEAKRVLASRDASETVVSEALKVKQAAAAREQQIASLASMPPEKRIAALEAMGFKRDDIYDAFEHDVLSTAQKREEQAKMSERERELSAKLEEQESKLREYNEAKSQWQRQQAEEAEVAQVNALYEEISTSTAHALQKAKISAEHAPMFLEPIAKQIDRAKRLGLEIGPDELAETVMKERESVADGFYGALEIPALAERLEAISVDDPDKPGAKVSRLKLLMRHEAARIRSRLNGAQPVAAARIAQPQRAQAQTREELMDAARTFGGGGTF